MQESLFKTLDEVIGEKQSNVDIGEFWKKANFRNIVKVVASVDVESSKVWKKFQNCLGDAVAEAVNRAFKGGSYVPTSHVKYKRMVKYIKNEAHKIVEERRAELKANPKDPEQYDMLDIMMMTPIAMDGDRPIYMSNRLVEFNLITIVSAGQATTVSLLSWCLNYLFDPNLGNGNVRYKLIQEVDKVSKGDRNHKLTVSEMYTKLPYLTQTLLETLRMVPPIPVVNRRSLRTTQIGEYRIEKGAHIMISLQGIHMNEKYWPDPYKFDPTRFSPQREHERIPYSFIPWTAGSRQCIGREFALLTARLGLFTMLNKYMLEMSPKSNVFAQEEIFVFARNLLMNFTARPHEPLDPADCHPAPATPSREVAPVRGLEDLAWTSEYEMKVVAGSNNVSGSTVTAAQRTIQKLLEFKFKLSGCPEEPNSLVPLLEQGTEVFTILIIFVATYQGKPSASTKDLLQWVQNNSPNGVMEKMKNIHYCVFGFGNTSWASTYQHVPKIIDQGLEALGAKRFCEFQSYNEASDDLDEAFSSFFDTLIPGLYNCLPRPTDRPSASRLDHQLSMVELTRVKKAGRNLKASMKVSTVNFQYLGDAKSGVPSTFIPTCSAAGKQVFPCTIKTIRNITPNAERGTIHMELNNPEHIKYRAGDHLVICPEMPQTLVNRVLQHFPDFDKDSVVQWTSKYEHAMCSFRLPKNTPVTVGNLLTNCLDLKATPTKQFLVNLRTLVIDFESDKTLKEITVSPEAFKQWQTNNQPITVTDAIDMFPVDPKQFDRLLEFLPLLKPRPYSISSSYLADPTTIHLTISVVEDFFPNEKVYTGVCSYYLFSHLLNKTKNSEENNNNGKNGSSKNGSLKEVTENVTLYAYVEPVDENFNVPHDDTKPIVLISAGTGFAPMRAFIQERAARKASGDVYVFFGCRNEEQDLLYDEELREYEKQGVITGRWTGFSRSKNHPSEYVQSKVLQQKELIWDVIENRGGHIYVCGSALRVGVGIRDALVEIISEMKPCDKDAADAYVSALSDAGRYELDVWG